MDAKARTLHSPSPLSLQHICMDSLLRGNFEHPERLGKMNSDIQEYLLSHYLLSRNPALSAEHKKYCLVAAHLINRQTRALDFSNWGAEFWDDAVGGEEHLNRYFSLLLSAASVKAPNLELLELHTYQRKADSDDDLDKEEEGNLRRACTINRYCFQYLLSLKNLKHLHVSGAWKWGNGEFLELSKRLTNLETLRISLWPESFDEDGLKNLHKLKHLQEFCFLSPVEYLESDHYYSLHSCCAQHGYRVIGIRVEDCFNSDLKFCISMLKDFTPNIPSVESANRIEDLHTSFGLPNDPLPNLRHLLLQGPSTDYKVMDKVGSYKKLFHLALVELNKDTCISLLQVAGSRLSQLYLDCSKLDLYHVLFLCPNLTELSCNSDVETASSYQVWITSHHFRLLRKLYVRFTKGAPHDFFGFALNAPHLEELYFRRLRILYNDCKAVEKLSDESLSKLKKFHLRKLALYACSMRDVSSLVKTVISSAPLLTDVQIDWDNLANEKKWAKERRGALATIKLIKRKNAFQCKSKMI